MARHLQKNMRFFSNCGRKGGLKRALRLSKPERMAIASKAAKARWDKAPPQQKLMSSVRLNQPQLHNPVFLEELLSEGSLDQWTLLYQMIADFPFGPVTFSLERVLSSTKIYGVTRLWKGILKGVQEGSSA